jgi:hypothetical protein
MSEQTVTAVRERGSYGEGHRRANSGNGAGALLFRGRVCEPVDATQLLPLDHSFLPYKMELAEYGFRVEKNSIKEQTVTVQREA